VNLLAMPLKGEAALAAHLGYAFSSNAATLNAEDFNLHVLGRVRFLSLQGCGEVGKIAWNFAAVFFHERSLALRLVERKRPDGYWHWRMTLGDGLGEPERRGDEQGQGALPASAVPTSWG
jgi:hypothetical protein